MRGFRLVAAGRTCRPLLLVLLGDVAGDDHRAGVGWALRDGLVLLTAAICATALAMAAAYFIQ